MKYTGQDVEALKKQFRPQAERQVKTRLALEYVAKTEGLEATDEDVEEEYKKIAEGYGLEVEKVKDAIGAEAVKADVVVGKAVLFVRDNADVSGAKKKATRKPAAKKATAETAEETAPESKPAAKKTTRKTTAKKTEEKSEDKAE